MELPIGQEGEMPIPLNISYGGGQPVHGHMINHDHQHQPSHNNHIIPCSTGGGGGLSPQIPSNVPPMSSTFKKLIRYRECLKNHAANMGGNATDGCGEFMPSGEEGSLEALTCSACNCHRNFHRKEIEGDNNISCFHNVSQRMGRNLFMGHQTIGGYHHGGAMMSSRAVAPHQMIMPYSIIGGSPPSHSDDAEEGGDGSGGGVVLARSSQMVKKRFRTKFTPEQKEKMLSFAEKVGWKIQRQEEGVVQQFCQEIGVKRRVLKVWMHNNKHNLAKKNLESNPQS